MAAVAAGRCAPSRSVRRAKLLLPLLLRLLLLRLLLLPLLLPLVLLLPLLLPLMPLVRYRHKHQ